MTNTRGKSIQASLTKLNIPSPIKKKSKSTKKVDNRKSPKGSLKTGSTPKKNSKKKTKAAVQ